ncbi:MAG: methyltransferase domain-containing protein [Phycisphaerales bacterium]|nr:MAG: methyltransferase domain-containing protein [Phycisphaerales bacterium]
MCMIARTASGLTRCAVRTTIRRPNRGHRASNIREARPALRHLTARGSLAAPAGARSSADRTAGTQMKPLTNRTLTPELMDEPEASRDDLAVSLRFIRFVNRRLGGTSSAIRAIERWARLKGDDWPHDRPIRVLDIGTGSADIPVAMAKWAKRHHRAIEIDAVDLHPTTLNLAREYVGKHENIHLRQLDALKLMDHYEPGSFDVVHAGMFLHHLPDLEVMTVLRIMQRLAQHGMIWNDLARRTLARIGVRAMVALTPGLPRMARHDAVVSVEAGFTRREAVVLAQRVGWEEIQYRDVLWHRFVLTGVNPE